MKIDLGVVAVWVVIFLTCIAFWYGVISSAIKIF